MSKLPAIVVNQSLVGWFAMLKSGGPMLRVVRETPKIVLVKWWDPVSCWERAAIYPKDVLYFWTGAAAHF